MNNEKVYLKGHVVGHSADTLGYQGLMVQLENLDIVEIDKNLVHRDVNEPKLLKLKDVITRIKGFDSRTKNVWIDAILNELGSDYGTLKYKVGYEQGKFEGAIEHEKIAVPKHIDEFITEQKKLGHTLSYSIDVCMPDQVAEWYWDNSEPFALAWINGYTVEKEKRYFVRLKHAGISNSLLKRTPKGEWWFGINFDDESQTHTRKQLEEAGFGEVFNSTLFEVEEVTE